jgi:hypothetical protein
MMRINFRELRRNALRDGLRLYKALLLKMLTRSEIKRWGKFSPKGEAAECHFVRLIVTFQESCYPVVFIIVEAPRECPN